MAFTSDGRFELTVGKHRIDVATVFLGLMCTIMVAGIPWANSVGSRLARIETKLESVTAVEARMTAAETRLREIEKELAIHHSMMEGVGD